MSSAARVEWHDGGNSWPWPCQCYCSQNHSEKPCCTMDEIVIAGGHPICRPCAAAIKVPLLAGVKHDLVRILYSRTLR